MGLFQNLKPFVFFEAMPRAGGAAAAAPADDERHRDVVLGWIYEFLSRNRMEEAKEGAMAAAPLFCASRLFVRVALPCRAPRRPPIEGRGARAVLHACVAALHHALVGLLVKPCVRANSRPLPGHPARLRGWLGRSSPHQERGKKVPRVQRHVLAAHGPGFSAARVARRGRGGSRSPRAWPQPSGVSTARPRVTARVFSFLLSCCAPLPAVVMLTELRADGSSIRRCMSLSCSWRTTRQTSAKSCTPKRCRESSCSR